jgi:hypothetical protein
VTVDDPAVAAAAFSWEEGRDRLAEPGRLRAVRLRIADAVQEEVRRRVGVAFTLAQLARVYDDASSWYFDLAARIAPRQPEAWDPAVALDGAFGLHMRRASDAER